MIHCKRGLEAAAASARIPQGACPDLISSEIEKGLSFWGRPLLCSPLPEGGSCARYNPIIQKGPDSLNEKRVPSPTAWLVRRYQANGAAPTKDGDMSERILLVDDDDLLRRSLAFSLENAGYVVDAAASSARALS